MEWFPTMYKIHVSGNLFRHHPSCFPSLCLCVLYSVHTTLYSVNGENIICQLFILFCTSWTVLFLDTSILCIGLGTFQLFWNRSVLERGPSAKSFRSRSSFLSFRSRSVPFWIEERSSRSVPFLAFLVEERLHPSFSVLNQERFHPSFRS